VNLPTCICCAMLAAAQHGSVQLTILTIDDDSLARALRVTRSRRGVIRRGISQQVLGRGARREGECAVASTDLL
jgi:hypothetical protein